MDELVLIGVSDEAEVDAGTPDGFAIGVAVELSIAERGLVDIGLHGTGPEFGAAGNCDGEAALAPQAAEGQGTVVIWRSDEGDLAVAVCVGPPWWRGKVQRGFVGRLDLDDVACPAGGVVEDVLVALYDVEIVVRNVLHVEPPAGVATRAKRVVDHIAHGSDIHGAQAVESGRSHVEELVGPDEVGLYFCGDAEEFAIETGYGGTGGETKRDLANQAIARQVVEGVEGDDLMTEPLECPEAVEGRFLGGKACGVQNLHGGTAFSLRSTLVAGP